MPRVIVGTSGWNYDHWRGVFYPEGLPRSRWLEHYAGTFATVELNASFYRSMRPQTFEKWRKTTPEGFIWAIKANRFITHIRRLADVEDSLMRFMASTEPLKEKRGPVLFQLPPSLAFDKVLAEEFMSLKKEGDLWVIEARNKSWATDKALACLRERGVAWCISDTAGRYPLLVTVTAGFAYIRLHGSRRLYASCYTQEELEKWAETIVSLGVDTYVYFDNDFMGHAPVNARQLMEILKQ